MGRDGSGVKAASETSIEINFIYKGIRCRERIKLKPTSTNIKKAERHREAVLHAIENGTFDYSVTFPGSKNIEKFTGKPKLTVGRYLERWLDGKRQQVKTSTYRDYEKTFRIIIAQFGGMDLTQLKRKHIAEWAATLDCSMKRISNLISPLRAAMTDAMHHELIEVNPIQGWTYKKVMPPKKTPVDPFTKSEQESILQELTGQGRNLIQFAFWTGLRTSELVALQWGDIDWQRGIVRVERAKTQYAKGDETTKTKHGERDVKLLPPALEALKDQKQYTFLQDQQVFFNPRTNEPWIGDQAIRKTLWIPALKRAGIRYRKCYQTRHTFASMMLSSGEPLAWVSRQLGHSNVLMTAKVYATWIPDSRPEAGMKAVELFSNRG
jgi:integrase